VADAQIDTTNRFMVGLIGEKFQILNLRALRGPITKADAFNLAAYLVAMAEEDAGEFQRVLDAVQNT
jgi:hypothetical protein